MIVEVRENVLSIFRSPATLLISTTFLYRLFSMKGPFFTDLDIGCLPHFLRLTMKRLDGLCVSRVL